MHIYLNNNKIPRGGGAEDETSRPLGERENRLKIYDLGPMYYRNEHPEISVPWTYWVILFEFEKPLVNKSFTVDLDYTYDISEFSEIQKSWWGPYSTQHISQSIYCNWLKGIYDNYNKIILNPGDENRYAALALDTIGYMQSHSILPQYDLLKGFTINNISITLNDSTFDNIIIPTKFTDNSNYMLVSNIIFNNNGSKWNASSTIKNGSLQSQLYYENELIAYRNSHQSYVIVPKSYKIIPKCKFRCNKVSTTDTECVYSIFADSVNLSGIQKHYDIVDNNPLILETTIVNHTQIIDLNYEIQGIDNTNNLVLGTYFQI